MGGQAARVGAGLHLDAGERGALLLCFDDAGGLAVDVEQVVRGAVAGVQLELAQRQTARGGEIRGFVVLNGPTCCG